MHSRLWWGLGLTSALSVVALWPRPGVPLTQAVERSGRAGGDAAAASNTPLPWNRPAWNIDPAQRDPFAPDRAEQVPHPPVVDDPVPAAAHSEPQEAPAPDYRYLGVFVTPAGQSLTLLARGTASFLVTIGTVLDDSYRVHSVDADGVRLIEQGSGTAVLIAPPPPGP